jgi:drug/metabolite transporter (DMT)-like permease
LRIGPFARRQSWPTRIVRRVDIVLALVAALLFALGTVLQQKAGLDEPSEGSGSSVLLRMVRRPVWLAGVAADALGFVAQAAALGVGRLAVVQPLLIASIVFALPLGARLTGQRVQRIDLGAALLVLGALVVFLTVANPSGGHEDAPFRDWLIAGAVCALACVPLVLLARRASPTRRAALLGIATGILFALSAALTKTVVDELGDGVLDVLSSWHLYALIAVGYASMTLNQLALDTGALAAAVATSTAFDPITSVIVGAALFDESLHSAPGELLATAAALIAALAGMAVLARARAESEQAVSPASPAPRIRAG